MENERIEKPPAVPDTALLICPETARVVERPLLGLTIGSRLLHALARAGVKRVVCVGEGPTPVSNRASIEVVKWNRDVPAPGSDEFLLLTADLTFSPGLINEGREGLVDYPIRRLPAEAFTDVARDPKHWLEVLGTGVAIRGARFAIRIVDRISLKKAKAALLNSLRKDIDGFISKQLNRHISISISRLLVNTGISPNFLTVVFSVVGIAAAGAAFIAEDPWMFVLAGFLFQAQSILDGCDGEIARLTYRFSKSGQWLDTIGDDITNYLFCLALAANQARVNGWTWLYYFGGVTLLFQVLTTGILYRRLIQWGTGDLLAVPDTLTKGQISGVLGKVLGLLGVIRKRDFFVFLVSVLTAAQLPLVGFSLIAIGTYVSFVGILVNDIRISKMQRDGTFERQVTRTTV